jgi:hypothetical protein
VSAGRAGTGPAVRTPGLAGVSQAGQLDLTISDDGSVRILFTPAGERA